MRRSWMFWLLLAARALPAWGQNSISVACPGSATAGSTILCSVSLSLGGGVSVDSLTFGVLVTPVASAPALNGVNLDFNSALPNAFVQGTPNAVAVLATPSPALTGNLALGTASIPLPSAAAIGQSYSVAFSNVSASFNNNLVTVATGPAATVAIIAPPVLGLTRTSLNFGPLAVGSPSSGQTVTLTNGGAGAFSLSLSVSGDFAETTTCGGTLAAGASCTVTVTFTPTLAGRRTGALSINHGGLNSPIQVRLFGAGTSGAAGSKASLSGVALNFGVQTVNSTSAPKTVTLTNNGDTALAVTSITAVGNFAQNNTCGASVAISGACTMNVTFTPTGAGARLGVITIVDSAAGSPHVIRLYGIGSGTAPAIGFSSLSVNFGNQSNGVASAAKTVTVTNTGNATLTITAVAATAEFSASGCVTSLSAGSTCTLSITFTPAATGLRQGSVTVTDNASGSPQVIRLLGAGT